MKSLRVLLVLLVAFAFGSDLVAKTPVSKDKKKTPAAAGKFPTFEKVTQAVETHLTANRNYQPGDLLTTAQIEPIFRKLEKLSWKVADRREILKSVLPDSDWLARQFATQNGRAFMRQISDLPGGYDRVDHLRRLPYGQQQLADLMRGPDGYKLFEYMTTTQGGKNLGRMLSQDAGGKNFNGPTGRIYTELDFIKRLKKSYDKEAVRRLAIEPPTPTKDQPGPPAEQSTTPSASQKPGSSPKESITDDPFEKLPRS